jgi:hypothetical protein
VSAVSAGDAFVLGPSLVTAEFGLAIAVMMAVAMGAEERLAVGGALLVDRVTVVEAVVTADTLESVRLLGGAELARLVTLVMTVAVAASRGDTVLGALVVDGHFVARTVLAWNAGSAVHVVEIVVLQLDCIAEGVLVCAELGHGVALGVSVARGTSGRDAVLGASVVDGILAAVAELAGDALVLVALDVGAELGRADVTLAAVVVVVALRSLWRYARVWALSIDREIVSAVITRGALVLEVSLVAAEFLPLGTVRVSIAMGTKLRDTVGGASLVDRVGVLVAVLAANALVLMLRIGRAKLSFHVAVSMRVAVSVLLRDAVPGASLVNRVGVLAAVLAADTLVLVSTAGGAELMAHVAVGVVVAVGSIFSDAVLRALVIDRVPVFAAVLARDALVLVRRVLVTAAELVVRVAAVVAIAARSHFRDAVLRTLAVDCVLVALAPLAADTAVLIKRVLGAELTLWVAMVMAVAGCEERRGAVARALAVDGVRILGAVGARDTRELKALDLGAEF